MPTNEQALIEQLLGEIKLLREERDLLRFRQEHLEVDLLRRSEDLLKQRELNDLILSAAGEGIYGTDHEDRATFLNPAAERMLGYKASELLGKQAHEILHHSCPDGSPYPIEECPIYRTLQDGLARQGDDVVFWRKDGSCFPVEYASTPMRVGGKTVGAVFTFKDISERKRLWLALQDSESKLRSIIENAADAIYLKDLDGRFLLINPAGAAFLGHPTQEIIGKQEIDFCGEEAGVVLRLEDQRVLNSGAVQTFEHRMRTGGSERVFLATKYPFRAPNGQIIGVMGISRDITDRIRMEEDLRRSKDELELRVQERTADLVAANETLRTEITVRTHAQEALQRATDELADLYNHAPCGYHSLDKHGLIVRINDTELDWLGYAREEVVGRLKIYDLLTPNSAVAVRAGFPTFLQTGVVKDLEVELVRRDGSILSVLLSATVLRDAAGNYLKSRATLYDITARKRAEERLHKSEAGLANAQRIAHLGNWDWDIQDNTLSWSDEVYRIFGLQPQEFGATYEAFLERVHPDDRQVVNKAVDNALLQRKAYGIDHRIVRMDGVVRFVHEQAEVTYDEHGRPVSLSGTVQDVTDYKNAQEEIARREASLQQAKDLDRLKNNFINAVSHDLRAPIMSVLGYAELLEDEVGGSITSQQQDFVAQIVKSTKRLEFMVNDLLDLARMEAGTFKLNFADEDLRAKIFEVVESLRPLFEDAKLELEVRLPEEPLMAQMDGPRIERVLTNLMTNAIKFTAAGGKISLRACREDSHLLCEVDDTGIGIAPEELPLLFQRFSQLNAGKLQGGTGLGLSISKAFVEAHGGSIGVRSEPGKGSTFWFLLPLNAKN